MFVRPLRCRQRWIRSNRIDVGCNSPSQGGGLLHRRSPRTCDMYSGDSIGTCTASAPHQIVTSFHDYAPKCGYRGALDSLLTGLNAMDQYMK